MCKPPSLTGLCRYCEITNWQTKNRCREQLVTLVPQVDIFEKDTEEPVIHLRRLAEDTFEASITNLRMLSNYSITVRANYGDTNWLPSRGDMPTDNSQPQVFVETKSCEFLCLLVRRNHFN